MYKNTIYRYTRNLLQKLNTEPAGYGVIF